MNWGVTMKTRVGTRDEIARLKKVVRDSKDDSFKKRVLSVRLVCEEYPIEQAANIADCCVKTVYTNLKKYEEQGIEGLYSKKPPGANTKLSKEQEARLYETIKDKLPRDVGFAPFVNWTAPLAVKYVLAEFGVVFSERGMRNLFERINLSYTRPTYTLKKADAQKQEQFKQEFESIKKTDLW